MPIKIEVSVAAPAPAPVAAAPASVPKRISTTNANINTTSTSTSTSVDRSSYTGPKIMPMVMVVEPGGKDAEEALKRPSLSTPRFRPEASKKQAEHEASSTISMAGPIMERIKEANAYGKKINTSLSLSNHSGHSTGTASTDGEGGPVKVFKRKSKKKKSFQPKFTELPKPDEEGNKEEEEGIIS